MRPRSGWTLAAAAALAALASACEEQTSRSRPILLTLADLEAATARPDEPLLPASGVPGGLPLADYVTKEGEAFRLTLRETWTEGYRSGYVTTELWSGFDEVWVQPMYVPFTDLLDGVPVPLKGADGKWHPIFSVGPKSAFYSPFWQLFYFRVPEGTDPAAYKSARDVIDSGAELHSARGRTIALVPGEVVLPATTTVTPPPNVPGGDREIGTPKQGTGYLDGEPVFTIELGSENFRWDEHLVVEEIPLFVLLHRTPEGLLERLPVPTVAGTGPLYENRPIEISDPHHPKYGAYWRVYTVELPPTARVFAPTPLYDAFRAQLPPALLAADAPYGADYLQLAGTDQLFLDDWLGRVSLGAVPTDGATEGCFSKYAYLTGDDKTVPCRWLDSQPAIEEAVVPEAIQRTDIVVTCPFVTYHDLAVTP